MQRTGSIAKMSDLCLMQLEESKEQYVEGERRIASLKGIVDEKERELSTAAQKLKEALSTMASKDTTIKQLEEDVQKYVLRKTHSVRTHVHITFIIYEENV